MRSNPIPLITLCLLVSFSSLAQTVSPHSLFLKSGTVIPEKNIDTEALKFFNINASKFDNKSFAVIQFEQIPTPAERLQLSQSGIELLDYIPDNAYTVTITGSLNSDLLNRVKARSIINLTATQKMQPELAIGNFPGWSVKAAGTIDTWISFPKTFSFETVKNELLKKGFEIISTEHKDYRIIALRVAVQRLGELALLPFIEFVQAAPSEAVAINYNSMFLSRANMLKAPVAFGGKNLNGQGIVVGIGEDGDIQTHIDFTERLINRAGHIPRAHATHVSGTIGGAGILNELYAGYAPKATLIGQIFTQIFTHAPTYVQDHGMVITNNSYGSVVNDCAYNGLYDLTARILDQQAFDLPELQHVFAAGNDGSRTCAPYPTSFKTVLGGFQSAKNILTVGASDFKGDIAAFSSRGPVRDGRLKPEITSQGQFVASTWFFNQYSYNNGTSMAAPGVSGGLALLIQRYRQLNSGANPKSGLMKALLCNGGNDKGNAGPDFRYGFGNINLVRSLKMMEDATYTTSSATQGSTSTQSITVPLNTAQLKVMLYWQDPPAAVMASKTLVNDLDLLVLLSGDTTFPAKLDTIAANVNNPAGSGADHMNNIEQIVINSPAAGSYDLKVLGTLIAQNPSQQYFLVYDIIPQSLLLTNPVGGEALTPTGTYFFGAQVFDTMYVQWDDYSSPTNEMFTVEFSDNDGSTWSTLSNTIPATERLYKWVVPAIPTELAKIRLTKNNTVFTQTSNAFTITALPVVSLSSTQCEGYISINWVAVPGATDYQVMKLQGDEMVSIATTNALNYTFSGLSKDTVYWVTVRARINGKPGRRANAVSRQPNSGSCAGNISDNDLKIDSVVSPFSSGRLFTLSSLANNVPITVRIKNLDDIASSGNIIVSYSINGGPIVSEIITTPVADIAAGGFIDHTFTSPENLSAAGTYNIQFTATKTGDPVVANNSYTKEVKQLNNQLIDNADLPWLDNLETAAEQSVVVRQMGLTGRDRYDFGNSTVNGRLRTFVNSGIAYSGNRALTLDMSLYSLAGNVDSLTGTFNLNNFTTSDDIRLDFRYKNHGQLSNAANRAWIRGSETNSWIEVYDLFANQPDADGSYKISSSIELSDSLAVHGQSYSTSFQVRWGQWGQYMAADNESAAGYTFDDIRIYRAIDDVQLVSIDTPATISCGLSNMVRVKVAVRNTSNSTLNNIPVFLRVDGILVASETVPSVPANDTIHYTFNPPGTASLSPPGNHLVEVWVDYITDNVIDNDTAAIVVNSLPYVTSFPYLENFEGGNGSWYTAAAGNSTWQYGTPISAKVKRAASGTKAWKTNIAGYYNDAELSYLYSPCFNVSAMTNPTLSFSLALDTEDCGPSLCDAAWVEYSDNGGISWNKLGAMGQGTNWYNKNYAGNQVWSRQDYTRWHVATTSLPTTNNSSLRFRFVFNSDAGLTKDGIAVDDIHIYDNVNGIYDGVTMTLPAEQTINAGINNWVHFLEGGKLVASVHPVGQAMGLTKAQAYINTGAVRISSSQYYHDRNITINPAIPVLNDSVSIRFYFLDTETETLINATGCGTCYKPTMAYEIGVSKYSDPNDNFENGTTTDNLQGAWLFINSEKAVKVPFDKGYYAEFKVKDFSEFWLNNGGINFNQPLPAQLISFTARKKNGKDVLAEWATASEYNVNRFEIEVAKGNADYQQNRFVKIGEVASQGNSVQEQRYSFTDTEFGKAGIRYYRLKISDNDGSIKYSAIRPVLFDQEISWQVFPNPSSGIFNLGLQANDDEALTVKVYDVNGRVVYQHNASGSGFVQKINIDLRDSKFADGLYLLEVTAGDKKQSFKLIKH